MPITLETGIKKFFCGPESFTPDLRPIVGEAPELKNYFVAAGLNSIGILTGGGLGRVLAHWIVNGTPDVDVTGFNIDRLHTYQANPEYRRERTIESLGMVYQCHYPTMTPHDRARREDLGDPRPAGRGARLFPRRQRLGGRRLVRAAGLRAEGREALVGPAELVPLVGGRASRRARGRDPHGHVVHEQVPGAGPRRRPRAQPHLGQQRRRRRRPHHLHAMAQRHGHARSRPHGDEARRRAVLGGRDRHHAPPRRDLDAAPHPRRRARVRHRRDLGLLPDQRAGSALARAAADADQRRSLERGVSVPRRARDRHRLRARAVHPHHLSRRARLRALHPGRAGDARLRPPGRGRRARSACATPG